MSNCKTPTEANALLEKLKKSGAYVPRKVQNKVIRAKGWGYLEKVVPPKLLNKMIQNGLTFGQTVWVIKNLPTR